MPKGKDLITVNNTNITPLITELVEYVKTQKAIEGVELQDLVKMPKANHPDGCLRRVLKRKREKKKIS